MASTFTTRLGLNKQAKGDNPGLWATDHNTGMDNAEARFMLSGAGVPDAVDGTYVGQKYFDTTNEVWWTCRTAGSPGIWVPTEHYIGEIMIAGIIQTSVPKGWLLCDGSPVSRADYSKLFGVVGEKYGIGDGVTTFNLPPGGVMPAAYKNADSDFGDRGDDGGEKTVDLVEDNVPEHTHGAAGDHGHGIRLSDTYGDHNDPNVQAGDTLDGTSADPIVQGGSHTHGAFGANPVVGHENLPPFSTFVFFIFAAESP